MQTCFSVRRGHSAAVYTSGHRSTSVGHQNNLFRVSHAVAPVDTRGLSMCETLTKKGKYSSFGKGKKHVFSLELCQNRQLYEKKQTIPSNVSNICVLSIPFLYRGE
ncbi:hypothetical protein AB205_0166460 [Aquarana catesbeiana]|uniref:Uncharacterized protein n=1 Tax=Aquarana catesbeiana TaxID=8400 RepID=A0A2G9QJ25_AQUCT|nr:hypothetical protein AB205_0166460 [Aquarana catesbeiana]